MIFEFRGIEAYGTDWVYGFIVRFQNDDSTYIYYIQEDTTQHIRNVRQTNWEVKPETVGLASSRKDRNGKTVFDGDILQKTQTDGSGSWLEVVKYTGDNWDNIHNCEESEIIGNIHLNKNLLK